MTELHRGLASLRLTRIMRFQLMSRPKSFPISLVGVYDIMAGIGLEAFLGM